MNGQGKVLLLYFYSEKEMKHNSVLEKLWLKNRVPL
jgi:hypothetical protein